MADKGIYETSYWLFPQNLLNYTLAALQPLRRDGGGKAFLGAGKEQNWQLPAILFSLTL